MSTKNLLYVWISIIFIAGLLIGVAVGVNNTKKTKLYVNESPTSAWFPSQKYSIKGMETWAYGADFYEEKDGCVIFKTNTISTEKICGYYRITTYESVDAGGKQAVN